MKPTTKADIARKYRDEYGMEMSQRSLAKIMFEKENLMFGTLEDARVALRRIEGKTGKKERTKVTHPAPPRTLTPYKLPEPDGEDLKPYVLPTSFNDFIFASDFHVPNHRIEPIEAMLKYAADNKVRKLIVGGDLLDNTPFTRWLHEPVIPSDVPRWFDMAKALLVVFKQHFDEVIFIEGNHDFWYKRWLMEKAPILFGDPYFSLEERLGLNQMGVKFVDQRYLVKAGRLNIHHGHLTFRGGGGYANAARMLYMKSKSNMLCGHVHVESSHTEPDIDDKICTTFTVGCMCTLRPEYQPFGGKACHGFAHIKVSPNKNFSVKNIRIYNGEIL
jgi:predicted phosphodiesterase